MDMLLPVLFFQFGACLIIAQQVARFNPMEKNLIKTSGNVDRLSREGTQMTFSTQTERLTVERLLGRSPRVPFEIATRCPDGTPQVLRANPVVWEDNRWKPFPTFLWLICPRLKKLVSQLEGEHEITVMQKRLQEDKIFQMRFIEGQRSLAERRLQLARELVPEGLEASVERVLRETNIAGSRHIFGVKCLHAHVAQFIAFGSNPIGEEILNRTGVCSLGIPCDETATLLASASTDVSDVSSDSLTPGKDVDQS
ncbi:MAG: DUF501 domain-containing protein [Candidatus Riflebacteria bacterium]|nr:DUF501 domain-containing protein [Candidatus Riflebacteria bacterium]